MPRLIAVTTSEDIFEQYQQSPIAQLLEYHNLNRPFDDHLTANLLIGMCMDNRKVDNGGWEQELAEKHFSYFAPMFEIGDAADFVVNEASRLRFRYPKILVAPLIYRIDDNLLYLVSEH